MSGSWMSVRLQCKCAALLVLLAFSASAQTPDAKRQAELVDLVREDCGSCHGTTLKGGLGRPLLPRQVGQYDTENLAAIIMNGVPGTPMPGWRGLLADEDARWIAERLKKGLPE